MNRTLHYAVFAAGLMAIGWVAAGYLPGNPLALALVLLIGTFYLLGAFELHRFQQATAGLAQALRSADAPPGALDAWLAPLHPSLRQTVRLRIEGERVALPGPTLTPYLVGLLVLLGMLGTFLGMVATLKGTGIALDNATDVQAIRASLAAPVKGLGLAFGTSVAGVAASATLGLMSALARRERLLAARQLDARIATTLRGYSRAHQRDESLRLLRLQTEAFPALVDQLQALVVQIERQGQASQDRLAAGQAEFHGEARRAYTALAESVDRSLKSSLTDSARLAGAAIEPAVQATMAGLAAQAATVRTALSASVQQQLDGVAARLDTTASALTGHWQAALSDQRQHSESVTQDLRASLDRYALTFEQRSAALLDGVAARLDRSTAQWVESWGDATAQQRLGDETLAQHTREALSHTLAGFEQHTAALLRGAAEAQAAWQSASAQNDRHRMSAFHEGLATMSATLEKTAQAIAAQAEVHARATVGEVARLVQVASAAPRAAADVIGEMRLALSDSLARDNAALAERNHLLATLGQLLDAVNHASTEQRAAIDALVNVTSGVLNQAGARFAETVAVESGRLQTVAAQVTGGAAEVASLGEGFGLAVELFSRASEQLTSQLQRIEAALGQSLARSDEQLAYYVAQAREIIDLTLGSQKQLVDELQQLSGARDGAPVASHRATRDQAA